MLVGTVDVLGMNQECTERIRSCYAQLYSEMRAEEVIPILFSRNALSEKDFDFLYSHCKSERDKNRYILIYIIMRGPIDSFYVLKQALKETHQIHLYDLLNRDAAQAPADCTPADCAPADSAPADDVARVDAATGSDRETPLLPPAEFNDLPLSAQCSDRDYAHDVNTRASSLTAVSLEGAAGRAEPVEHMCVPGVCEGGDDSNVDVTTRDASMRATHSLQAGSWGMIPEATRRKRPNRLGRRWHTLSTVHVVHTAFEEF